MENILDTELLHVESEGKCIGSTEMLPKGNLRRAGPVKGTV
jgi:hypothetical protein